VRLAILIPRLSGGGAEFVAGQWASYLRAQAHSVTIVTTHGGADPTVVALGSTRFVSRVGELRRHLQQAGYDVVLAMMPHWNVLALLAAAGRPKGSPAVVISGRNVESALRSSQGLSYRLELLLAQVLYRRADAYVAISHPVAAEAAAAYSIDPERIWVVPNPATGKVSVRPPGVRGPATTSSVTLTVPARLVPQKRPELALETAAVLRNHHGVQAAVAYFGRGPEEAALRAAALRLGVPTVFHGWVPDWFDRAAPDAVVLLPSAAEGFGNVLVEAAAVGIASVASSRALGVADAIVPNVTGVLTMGTTAEELAVGVTQAMALNPVSAPQWLQRFSPEESGEKLLHVLVAVTGARPSPAPVAEAPSLQSSR
jgi:glycosyltransferase involved in cell wall biosynthesis